MCQANSLGVSAGRSSATSTIIRWEKHRVWIVEANLKEGSRHTYHKRRLYIDEDTWTALASDAYDGPGNLWRVQYLYPANLYDRDSIYTQACGGYDLLQGIYNVNGKPVPGSFRNGQDKGDNFFRPKAWPGQAFVNPGRDSIVRNRLLS